MPDHYPYAPHNTVLPIGTYQKVKGKGINFTKPYESTAEFNGLAFEMNTRKGKIKMLIKKGQKLGFDDDGVIALLMGESLKVKLKDPDGKNTKAI